MPLREDAFDHSAGISVALLKTDSTILTLRKALQALTHVLSDSYYKPRPPKDQKHSCVASLTLRRSLRPQHALNDLIHMCRCGDAPPRTYSDDSYLPGDQSRDLETSCSGGRANHSLVAGLAAGERVRQHGSEPIYFHNSEPRRDDRHRRCGSECTAGGLFISGACETRHKKPQKTDVTCLDGIQEKNQEAMRLPDTRRAARAPAGSVAERIATLESRSAGQAVYPLHYNRFIRRTNASNRPETPLHQSLPNDAYIHAPQPTKNIPTYQALERPPTPSPVRKAIPVSSAPTKGMLSKSRTGAYIPTGLMEMTQTDATSPWRKDVRGGEARVVVGKLEEGVDAIVVQRGGVLERVIIDETTASNEEGALARIAREVGHLSTEMATLRRPHVLKASIAHDATTLAIGIQSIRRHLANESPTATSPQPISSVAAPYHRARK